MRGSSAGCASASAWSAICVWRVGVPSAAHTCIAPTRVSTPSRSASIARRPPPSVPRTSSARAAAPSAWRLACSEWRRIDAQSIGVAGPSTSSLRQPAEAHAMPRRAATACGWTSAWVRWVRTAKSRALTAPARAASLARGGEAARAARAAQQVHWSSASARRARMRARRGRRARSSVSSRASPSLAAKSSSASSWAAVRPSRSLAASTAAGSPSVGACASANESTAASSAPSRSPTNAPMRAGFSRAHVAAASSPPSSSPSADCATTPSAPSFARPVISFGSSVAIKMSNKPRLNAWMQCQRLVSGSSQLSTPDDTPNCSRNSLSRKPRSTELTKMSERPGMRLSLKSAYMSRNLSWCVHCR
mmetsp:Transcript_13865/g.41152  ORF Transcript_13865/g.41152 Transcript_13865/m.41152 type:complete len:363 (-) Transcript_13865:374-1462(-)